MPTPEIPPPLQERWEEVSEELRAASWLLNMAYQRYQAAIVARIALGEQLAEYNHQKH